MLNFRKIIYLSLFLLIGSHIQGFVAAQESAEMEDSVNDPSQVAAGRREGEVESFVENIGNKIINILVHRHNPMEVRKEKFRKILVHDFDMPTIGKFVISRYWRMMSDQQREDYLRLFIDAVVENYASQFNNYNNEKLIVKNARQTQDGGYIVYSTITRPGKGEPLKVDWKIFKTKRGMKVLDIIVDGVSMSITLRTEYAGAYNEKGGAEGLLAYLREKIAKSTVSADTAFEG